MVLVGKMRFNYIAANLIGIAVCSVVNFLLGDRFVFEAEAPWDAVVTGHDLD